MQLFATEPLQLGVKGVLGVGSRLGFFGGKGVSTTDNLYHTVANSGAGQGVLNGINPRRLNSSSRFGEAFYLSEKPDTTLAELLHHNTIGVDTIRFEFNSKSAKILDLTNPKIARAWEYKGGDITELTKNIGIQAQEMGFNVIRYSSERHAGVNLAVLNDFNQLLKPQMIVPSPTKPIFDPMFNLNFIGR